MPKGSWREFDDLSLNNNVEQDQYIESKANRTVKVQRMRAGKAGKTLTIISGIDLDDVKSKNLLKKLKIQCGTGGTLKGQKIELQGDQVKVSMDILLREGFRPKQVGG